MLQGKARWSVGQPEPHIAQTLEQALGVPPLVAKLLAVRGWTDIEQAAQFLHGGTEHTHDPYLLDGMEQAVERIRRAVEAGEYIRVYGDYDADGVSSTTLMVKLLQQLDCRFDTYIPHRVHEGYGLNTAALDAAKEAGVSLIITVDTGISAVEQIAYAAELGIDVVVTDHHEPPERLPDAYAIINPKKPTCSYPFKHLAGVGVSFKLAQALLGRWPEELLEYVAIGTVADLMHLSGENRIMVKQGIARMRSTTNYGIRSLLGVAGIALKDVNSTHIGFAIAPRINASGRLLSADTAVRLLTTDSEQEAEHLAHELDQLNKERQRIVDEMTKQAASMVERRKAADGKLPEAIVLADESWNVGVIGIVASKMVDRYYRPTIILGIDPDTGKAKGSARSIAGYDMYKALTRCDDLMEHYGGHPMAAGMTVARDHLPELEARMIQLAQEWLQPEDYIPVMQSDLECRFEDIHIDSIRQLEQLGPFGMGNPAPRFTFTELHVSEQRTLGKEHQHLKLTLKSSLEAAAGVEAIAFGKGALGEWISPSARMNVIGELSLNEWNGTCRPQIMVQDLCVPGVQLFDWRGTAQPERKLAEVLDRLKRLPGGERPARKPPVVIVFGSYVPDALRQLDAEAAVWTVDVFGTAAPHGLAAELISISEASDIVLYTVPDTMKQLQSVTTSALSVHRYFALFGSSEIDRQASTVPDRDMFKAVYGAASLLDKNGHQVGSVLAYEQAIAKRAGVSVGLVRFMLDVFTELGLAERIEGGFRLVAAAQKRELTSSTLYQARLKRPEAEQQLLYSSSRELLELLTDHLMTSEPILEEIV
ncbi:single-stranded-DNA-specific exonuclease RecJ [Paenibacillus sp. YYML68]|uniref:single-stranded-DNA-specific exonuclease RecJ n=1 Tax=Paenibacillus sp. YYML68 TaxID=2909250 RepID=UPI002490F6BA|nr:single-stranded-DNA-specific exonuclease RecJ [Paenibacillus sp. YYML68]